MSAPLKFLIVGSGGREHALAWKLSQGPGQPVVFVAPGHDGIAADPEIRGGCVPIDATASEALARFAAEECVDLTIVGPEAPLAAGIVDTFRALNLPIFGPTASAARLEASKAFAKALLDEAQVPTASWAQFTSLDEARAHARAQAHPLVIKADGLAAGKGVFICESLEQSEAALLELLGRGAMGRAGHRVIIEEFLRGVELSFMVATDGERILALPTSQDHKRLLEGDLGPNTGGMGAFSPSPLATPARIEQLKAQVIRPVLLALKRQGIAYSGFLYAGLMWTEAGPRVLEFNVRLGDPETQALLFGLNDELGAALLALTHGDPVDEALLLRDAQASMCVVLASAGYPGASVTGEVIEGLDLLEASPQLKVFHAGTKRQGQSWRNVGGRVLGVTARAASLNDARDMAMAAALKISWPGMQLRRDMGT